MDIDAGWLSDLIVVVSYLVFTALLGFRFSKKQKNVEAYFLGSRQLPGWAVGFSLLSTTMSSVTFLAYPTTAYLIDFRLLVKDFAYPLASFFTGLAVAPQFRKRLKTPSAYELLEQRYSYTVRLYGAALYIVSQIIKTATVLYLVSLPMGMLLGLPVSFMIIGMGVFVTCYSLAGGMAAVVYIDVMQAAILLLGGATAVLVVVLRTQGGLQTVISEGNAANKFSLGSWDWSWSQRTIPSVFIYGVVHYLGKFITFQDAVQRYLSVPSKKDVYVACAIPGILAVPTWALFYFIGVSLWVFYQHHEGVDAATEPDAIFPLFIMNQLPPGVGGVVISGVLAAAMSSVDSSLNAVSSVIVVDVIQRSFLPNSSDKVYMRLARITTILTSTVTVIAALSLTYINSESLNEAHNALYSVLAGGTTALFLIALFSEWVGNRAILVAIIVSTATNAYLAMGMLNDLPSSQQFFNTLHPYWVQPFVTIVFAVAAYLAEACLRTGWANRASARLHTALHGKSDLDKVNQLLTWTACELHLVVSSCVALAGSRGLGKSYLGKSLAGKRRCNLHQLRAGPSALEDWSKKQLEEECNKLGIPAYGTKATIVARIVNKRSESSQPPDEVQKKTKGEQAADKIATERYGKNVNALNGAELKDMLKLTGAAAVVGTKAEVRQMLLDMFNEGGPQIEGLIARGGKDEPVRNEPTDPADLDYESMTRDAIYEELALRGVDQRPRDRNRAESLLRQVIISQQVADRTEEADSILGLDISGLDMSHPTLGMSEDQLRSFLLKRGIRLNGDPAALVENVRSVAIIETIEPITSVGRLEEGDMDDLDLSDYSNQQIKEILIRDFGVSSKRANQGRDLLTQMLREELYAVRRKRNLAEPDPDVPVGIPKSEEMRWQYSEGILETINREVTSMKFSDLKDASTTRNLLPKTKREMQTGLRSLLIQDLATRILDQQDQSAQHQQAMQESARNADAERQQLINLQLPDPPLTVAVLFGGASSAPGLTLASARAISQFLHTSLEPNALQADSSDTSTSASGSLTNNGGSQQSQAAAGKAGSAGKEGVRELAAIREARENGMDEEACKSLQGVRVQPYFVAGDNSAWAVPRHFLLHNNPMEFAANLDDCQHFPSPQALGLHLREKADLVFSALDAPNEATILLLDQLNNMGVHLVGTPPEKALDCTHKGRLNLRLKQMEYPALNQLWLRADDLEEGVGGPARLGDWFLAEGIHLATGHVVVKMARGSESIGVQVCCGLASAWHAAVSLMAHPMVNEASDILVEPYQHTGTEFVVTVIETPRGPVALTPTELAMHTADLDVLRASSEIEEWVAAQEGNPEDGHQLGIAMRREWRAHDADTNMVSTLHKHAALPSLMRHTPPVHLSSEVIMGMRDAACKLFKDLGLRDVAQFEGWVQPPTTPVPIPEPEVNEFEGLDEEEITRRLAARADEEEDGHIESLVPLEEFAAEAAVETEEGGEERDDTLACFGQWWPQEDIVQITLDEDSLEVVDSTHGVKGPEGPLRSYKELEEADELDLLETEADEDNQDDEAEDDEDEDEEEMSAEEAHYWQACAEVDSLGQLADAAEARTASVSNAVAEDDTADEPAALEYPGHISQGVWVGRSPLWGDHPKGIVESEEEDGLWKMLLDGYGGSAEDDDADDWADTGLEDCPEAGIIASPIVPLEESTPEELCRWDRGLPRLEPLAHSDWNNTPLSDRWRVEALAAEEAQERWQESWRDGKDDQQEKRYMGLAKTDQMLESSSSFFGGSGSTPQPPSEDDWWSGPLSRDQEESTDAEARSKGAGPRPPSIRPQQVWVLMGGESSERQLSLQAGLNVWLQLQDDPTMEVHPFVLVPQWGFQNASERRMRLLRMRNELLKMGTDAEDLDDALHLGNIRSPMLLELPMRDRVVVSVPLHLMLQGSVEGIMDACSEAQRLYNTVDHARDPQDIRRHALHMQTQLELVAGGMEGVASAWGSDPFQGPPPPRFLDMQRLAEEARAAKAVIFTTLQGGSGEAGELQGFLERSMIPFTGSAWQACQLCIDKYETGRELAPLEMQSILAAPKTIATTERLIDGTTTEESAAILLASIQARCFQADAEPQTLCVKPRADGSSAGVARLDNYTDLSWFCTALLEQWPRIPGGVLSSHPEPIELPPHCPRSFIFESFIAGDTIDVSPVEVKRSKDGQLSGRWAVKREEGGTGWVEISSLLLGEPGRMRAMPPSLRIKTVGPVLTPHEHIMPGLGCCLTPLPPSLFQDRISDTIRSNLEVVADHMGLDGYARIDAFAHIDSGEVIILEIDTTPCLTPFSELWAQVAHEQGPEGWQPRQLLQQVVDMAVRSHLRRTHMLRQQVLHLREQREAEDKRKALAPRSASIPKARGSRGSGAAVLEPIS
ncbi:hypothetical protein WJX84_006707 [Apatococcus fuscideae]|uniref:Sodium/solute symporter n=1 Tax=Apatococcus fuscideae TaxID=2026836 RepID=A0AAW1T4C4_9CHLO